MESVAKLKDLRKAFLNRCPAAFLLGRSITCEQPYRASFSV
ncbi:hypothetical protein FM107_11465 [Sphingobacterium sp. JB170]|nr:hypothetical protein FM107_11465 [Sphingobacterium sp. JB170]